MKLIVLNAILDVEAAAVVAASRACLVLLTIREIIVNFTLRIEWLINFRLLKLSLSDTHINLRLCRDFDDCVGFGYIRWVDWRFEMMKTTMKMFTL